jgi:hypothetical protein
MASMCFAQRRLAVTIGDCANTPDSSSDHALQITTGCRSEYSQTGVHPGNRTQSCTLELAGL